MDDLKLLEAFASRQDQEAFAALVRRHQDWVYSTCLRRLRNAALAEDAVQAVFLALAMRAGAVSRRRAGGRLEGWLHTAARYAAARIRRTEHRLARRQQEVAAMRTESVAEAGWSDVEMALESALDALPGRDRECLLLRYYRQLSPRETAAALGISEPAANQRVSRATGRLRRILARQGVRTGAAALGTLLAAHAVTPSPAALAAALGQAGAPSPHAVALAKGSLKMMTAVRLKLAAAVSGGAVVVAAALSLALGRAQEDPPGKAARPAAAGAVAVASVPAADPGTAVSQPAAALAQSMPVRGRVDDTAGRPIANAEVVVVRCRREGDVQLPPQELAKAQSAADGSFAIDWPTDQTDYSYCYLRATAPGYAYSWARRSPVSSRESFLWLDEQRNVPAFDPRLTLVPACTMTGTVVDPQGRPVAGVEVRVHPARPAAVTDAAGRFSFDKLRPTHQGDFFSVTWMSFTHPEYLTKEYDQGNGSDLNRLTPETPLDLRVELARGAVVRGRVTDADTGKPAAGFAVRAVVADGPRGDWTFGAFAPVAADGSYQMRVRPGPVRLALVRAETPAPAAADAYPVQEFVTAAAAAEAPAVADLQVKRGSRVAGRVVLPAAVPAAVLGKLSVSVSEDSSPVAGGADRGQYTRVGPGGEFAFGGLRPGGHTFSLVMPVSGGAADVLRQPFAVVADAAPADVRLAPAADALLPRLPRVVTGRARLPDATPAAYARVVYIPQGVDEKSMFGTDAFTTASSTGEFSLTLPTYLPPECRLYVRDATGVYAALVPAKGAAEPTPLDIPLVEGGRATGRVTDSQGIPLVGWTVVYNRQNAHWNMSDVFPPPRPRFAATFTDAEGRYELTGLLPVPSAGPIEIAVTLDHEMTGGKHFGWQENEHQGYVAPAVVPGKTVDTLDFVVTRLERPRGTYHIRPRGANTGRLP